MTQSIALASGAPALQRFSAQDSYHNVNQLKQLGAMSANDAELALDKVSNQFESMLVQQMLKSMRQANQVWTEDSMFSSRTVKFYQQMMDDQLSVELGKDGTLGFADAISAQLSSMQRVQTPGASNDSSAAPGTTVSLDDGVHGIRRTRRPSVKPDAAIIGQVLVSEGKVSSRDDRPGLVTDSPESFIASLQPYARRAADQLGVPAEKIIAQAALETGWGKHIMQRPDGSSSYNLFGIKADSRWQGDKVVKATQEFLGGREMTVNASFRSYDSLEQAFADYVDFLQGNQRYEAVLNSSSDFALNLQRAGYATDPAYAEKIEGIASRLTVAGQNEVGQ